jgi:hypothetical protein
VPASQDRPRRVFIRGFVVCKRVWFLPTGFGPLDAKAIEEKQQILELTQLIGSRAEGGEGQGAGLQGTWIANGLKDWIKERADDGFGGGLVAWIIDIAIGLRVHGMMFEDGCIIGRPDRFNAMKPSRIGLGRVNQ